MDAYAVVESGGKQYRVGKGDVVRVEKLGAEAGAKVTFDRVLAVSNGSALKVGTPVVAGASVAAEVARALRGPKIVSFKKKRRKGYHRKVGHRQSLTEVRITDIVAG